MKNLVCLNSNTYHGFSLDEALRGASAAGFRYIELAAVRGYTEHIRWEMTDDEVDEVKNKLNAHNLECIAVAAHANLMSEEGFTNFKKSIELASRFGSKFIVTSTGDAHDDEEEIEDDNELIEVLKPLVAECEARGLTMVIETHGNNYATGMQVKALIEKVGSPNLAINYDTANVIFHGNTMPYDDLRQSADAVKLIHLKDKLGENREWNFPAIGQGYLDFAKIFRILQETNCTAPLSVEVEFTSDGPADLAEVDRAVKDSFEAVQKFMLQVTHR